MASLCRITRRHVPEDNTRHNNKAFSDVLEALYGPIFHHMQSASLQCTDLYFIRCCQHRCSVRTYISSDAAGIGALYGRIFHQMLPVTAVYGPILHQILQASWQCTELYFNRSCQHRYSARTYNSSDTAGIVAVY